MVAINPALIQNREDLIAELTQVAYHSVLNRGFRGSFLQLELSLWHALRQAVEPATLTETRTAKPIDAVDVATS